jgi:hypothetical protein
MVFLFLKTIIIVTRRLVNINGSIPDNVLIRFEIVIEEQKILVETSVINPLSGISNPINSPKVSSDRKSPSH